MTILHVFLFVILVTTMYMLLSQFSLTIAHTLLMIGSVLIFIQLLKPLQTIFKLLSELIDYTGQDNEQLTILIKVVLVAYISEFGASIAKDAGLESMSYQIILCGKIFILILALPTIQHIIELFISIIPTYDLSQMRVE